ncbi:hypothetical protein [Cumulibacter soli]|uniref:hypothetical protein n=1 Tax=Cumulibacter soli TaxID=2546344 RepID=UPI0010687D94|nr:hypothetical protein [Cumulibacter soli]
MTDATAADESAIVPAHESEEASTAAKRLGRFASAHGGAKFVYVEHISAFRSRIVVVAEDGRYGDQVVGSHETAMTACASAGFDVLEGEWDRDAVGAVRTTGYEWGLMGRGRTAGK